MKRTVSKTPLAIPAAFFAAGALALAGSTPGLAQPPEPGTQNVAYFIPDVENAWSRLRAETGLQELHEPRAVIARYQKFYEAQGATSAVTAIKISGVIAQLYWQMLSDRAKALQIYDWAIEKYGDLPTAELLRQGRALVAAQETYQQMVTALPVAVTAQNANAPQSAPATVSVHNPQPIAMPTDGLAPIAVAPVVPLNSAPSASLVVPVKIGEMPLTAPPVAVVPLAEVAPVGVPVVKTGTAAPSVAPVTPLAPGVTKNDASPLPIAPSANEQLPLNLPTVGAPPSLGGLQAPTFVAPVIIAPRGSTPDASGALPKAVTPVNARQTVLLGYVTQWRNGAMSWEQMREASQFTPEDVSLLASYLNVVSLYSDGRQIREKLGATIREYPRLEKGWSALPVPAQVALAESYTREKNPQAETIYKSLLEKDIPDGAWWNKELIQVRLAMYYGAMGDHIKAAETNLQIAQTTKVEAWRGDSLVEAGRFYQQKGDIAKALELYKRAQTSDYGWAQGLSLYEQSRLLMMEDKQEEARQVLSTPITGQYADQIQVVLVSLLGASYYRTDDWDAARRECHRAIALYQALQNPLREEGLQEHVALAKRILALMEKWPQTPMESQPAELRIVLKAGEKTDEPRRERLDLHSFKRIHITVESDSKEVAPQVPPFERAADNGLDFSYAVMVQLSPEALRDGFAATLTVTSPEHPDFKVRVPVRVKVEKPDNAKREK